jgi:hypothetical protein
MDVGQRAGRVARSTADAPVAPSSGKRDQRIDFLRGLALIFIFVDHVPDSLFSLVTLRAYAFADAAELFFFMSGFVAAMVYGRMAETSGLLAAARKIWRRTAVLYLAQILLFVFVVAEVALAVAGTGHAGYPAEYRIDAVLTQPGVAILHALLLRYQPAYLDILPVYVVLLFVFPLVLLLLARNVWLVLVPSAALYFAVQIFALTPHTFPNGSGWFFNPLAWQFLFFLGASLGHPHLRGRWRVLDNAWLLRVAAAFAAIVALMEIPEALRMVWPHIASLQPSGLPMNKAALEPLRILSFLALAILARRYLPAGPALARSAIGRGLMRCGRYSLQIFMAGVVLAVAGRIIASETGHSLLIQFMVSTVGIGMLLAFAAGLEGWGLRGRWFGLFGTGRAHAA